MGRFVRLLSGQNNEVSEQWAVPPSGWNSGALNSLKHEGLMDSHKT